MKIVTETFEHRLIQVNRGTVFIGTQKGCAQAVKDLGLDRGSFIVCGLNKFERARIQLRGKPMTGKLKEYFEVHCM